MSWPDNGSMSCERRSTVEQVDWSQYKFASSIGSPNPLHHSSQCLLQAYIFPADSYTLDLPVWPQESCVPCPSITQWKTGW